MEYNFLSPNCGLKVSAICLGTMTMKKGGGKSILSTVSAEEAESHRILDRYKELGGNFLDSADIYEGGDSEMVIGDWMKKNGNRQDMVVATKCRSSIRGSGIGIDLSRPNAMGLSRKWIIESVEGSLKRMQTDYIDLFQIHGPDMGTPFAETLRTLDDLIRCGKIHYAGACNLKGWQMQKFVDIGRELGLNPMATLQQHYCVMERGTEQEALEVCLNEGLGVLPWSPLKGGLLTGKYKKGQAAPEGSRLSFTATHKLDIDAAPDYERVFKDEGFWKLMDAMNKAAKHHKKSVAQVALRWLLQTPPVTSVIIGTTKLSQLEDNMGAVGWKLTDEEMEELNSLTEPKLSYPYSMIKTLLNDGRYKTPPYV